MDHQKVATFAKGPNKNAAANKISTGKNYDLQIPILMNFGNGLATGKILRYRVICTTQFPSDKLNILGANRKRLGDYQNSRAACKAKMAFRNRDGINHATRETLELRRYCAEIVALAR